MEEEQHFSTTSMSSDSHDYDEPVCPKSPKRRPFSIHMHAIPAQEKLDLIGGNSTGNLVLRPDSGDKERKGRSGAKISLFDFMELRHIQNKRKISL